jgi:hypothetical protein
MIKLHFLARAALLTFAFCVASSTVWAADKEGCKDVPGMKRFEGSQIVLCSMRNFVEYTLPTGKLDGYNRRRLVGLDKEDLEGKLVQNVYEVPMGASSAEVFRNYKNDFSATGFKILYEAKQLDTEPLQRYFGDGLGGQIFGNSEEEARYAAAVRDENGVKTYIAQYIVEFRDGAAPSGVNPKKGQVYVRLDAITAGELKNKMTTYP